MKVYIVIYADKDYANNDAYTIRKVFKTDDLAIQYCHENGITIANIIEKEVLKSIEEK